MKKDDAKLKWCHRTISLGGTALCLTDDCMAWVETYPDYKDGVPTETGYCGLVEMGIEFTRTTRPPE